MIHRLKNHRSQMGGLWYQDIWRHRACSCPPPGAFLGERSQASIRVFLGERSQASIRAFLGECSQASVRVFLCAQVPLTEFVFWQGLGRAWSQCGVCEVALGDDCVALCTAATVQLVLTMGRCRGEEGRYTDTSVSLALGDNVVVPHQHLST